MTNFESFKYECKSVKKFACHVFYENNTLETINGNLERLCSIDEGTIVYFEGAWLNSEARRIEVINTFSAYGAHSVVSFDTDRDTYLSPYSAFHTAMLYHLHDIGIDTNIIDSLVSKLYEEYSVEEKMQANIHLFQKHWENKINIWDDYKNGACLTLFFGKTNPEFSNFYIAPFTIDGEIYNSVEHYFMFKKASIFDPDGDVIKQLGNDKTPAQIKKLGRQVRNFDAGTWNYHGRVAMYEAVYAKFEQNPLLKSKLLDTGCSILAEASPWDKKWGIGVGISSKDVRNSNKWKGLNWLGLILMGVRGELRYGKIDFESIDFHELNVFIDFFSEPDWPELAYCYCENPEYYDKYYYRTICAQATGNMG